MVCPQVICLNGTSSSGKTTIAHKLQELLPEIYLNFSIDSILYALPGSALFRMTHGQGMSDPNYVQLVRSLVSFSALSAENLMLAAEPEREVEKETGMADVPAQGSLVLVAEPEGEVEKESRMSDCSIEGEDRC